MSCFFVFSCSFEKKKGALAQDYSSIVKARIFKASNFNAVYILNKVLIVQSIIMKFHNYVYFWCL